IALLAQRFNTAADFINFIEIRTDIGVKESFLVNDEEQNLRKMISHVRAIYSHRMQPTTEEILNRSVEAFQKIATGELLNYSSWQYGLVVDDMIARAHDVDPNLQWNTGPQLVA